MTLFSNGGGKPVRIADRRVIGRRRTILVAASLDESGVIAVQRGHGLSQIFGAALHLAHVLPNAVPPLVEDEAVVQQAVARWAAARANVVLPARSVHAAVGEPSVAIRHVAKLVGAELIVVGAPTKNGEAATIVSLASTISAGTALFVAHPPRTACEVVAATDLRDVRFPVVKIAAELAEALAARVTVVHNLENDGTVLALALENVAGRLQALERLANELDRIRGGRVSTTRTPADAIADVAENRDADIAVVGIRRGHGRTLLSLLERTTCSVLAVPLA